MTTMYGIPNCDTIKKAKNWLTENAVEFEFHNYKKDGIDQATLQSWLKQQPWDVLVNKRGTTWRKLDKAVQEAMDEKSAIAVMQENPSIIKRPVLVLDDGQIEVGFKADSYQSLFG